MNFLTEREACQKLGVGLEKLHHLERFGLAKLPGINKYAEKQLEDFVQWLINEQAKGWTLPSSEAGEREDGVRLFEDKPRRSGRRLINKAAEAGIHPLDRADVA